MFQILRSSKVGGDVRRDPVRGLAQFGLTICVLTERGDQPAAVGHLHAVLRSLPHPKADRDQEEADVPPG